MPKKSLFTLSLNVVLPLLLLLFFCLEAVAQQGLTPEQVAKIKTVTGATISVDGVHVAYTVRVPADPVKENRPGRPHLYVLNTQTGEARPYYSATPFGSVSFRPGHDSLTFLTRKDEDDTRSLYELPLDGGEAVKIFSFTRNITTYRWASDGNRIVFTAPEQLPAPQSELPYAPQIFEENMPDRHAYVANVRQKETEPVRIQADGTVYLMQWSPDDDRLALSAAPTPHVDDYYMHQQVFIVDSGTGEVISQVDNEGKIAQILWSPGGDRLALRAGRNIHDPIDGRILIALAEGGTPQIIDRDFEGKYEEIAWNEPGRIHFIASRGVYSTFGTIRPDGSDKQTIVDEGGPVLESFRQSGEGFTVFTANTPTHPGEVYLLEPRENQPKRMTITNPWLEEVDFGRQQVVRYETRDGEFEIEGLLIYPSGYSEGEPIPLITQVHGGPEAHYSHGWLTSYTMAGQMGAAGGYGVFYPNYRGSTGRGIEFVTSSQGDAGGKEFDDIKEDTRVHPSQSLELYRHLGVRKPDLPLRLVFYPDERHGNVNSTARYDYSLRMLRWFDTYLKTGDRRADLPHWEVGIPGE